VLGASGHGRGFTVTAIRLRGGGCPGGHPRGRHYCCCIIFQRLTFLFCYFTESTYRPILLLRSCFQLVLGLTPTLSPYITIVRTWNPNFLPPLLKLWRRPCQGKTVKVKFVYNRLTGENGGRPNQISHHLQKRTRGA